MLLLPGLLFFLMAAPAQNVGIGTTTPEGVLHLKGTGWIKTVFENSTGEPRGYIGADNNGTITIGANAYWNGSAWVYPYTGPSMYLLFHRPNQQFEFRVRPDGGSQSIPMVIEVGGNVGIGTTQPQQNLGVGGGAVIDQNNSNTGSLTGSLLFGNNSSEGIGSKRNTGGNYNGLDFYTNTVSRFNISNAGNIGINTGNNASKSRVTINHKGSIYIPVDQEVGHAFTIMDSSYFYIGEPKLTLNMGIQNTTKTGYITINESNPASYGTPKLILNPGGDAAVVIGGGYGGGAEALVEKFVVRGNITSLFENDVKLETNLTVQNGKGIIRNNSGTQLKQVITPVLINAPVIGGGGTHSQNITWSESFGGTPAAYVGNIITGGAGGWAEVIISLANVTASGATLYIFNARNFTVTPGFTVNIITTGPQ